MSMKQKRQEAAKARAAERAGRTPAQQLALLDQKLGTGRGATRERARLAALQAPAPVPAPATTPPKGKKKQ